MRELPYEERLQPLGLLSLQQLRQPADLIGGDLQDIQGSFGHWSELVFPHYSPSLRGHPYKILFVAFLQMHRKNNCYPNEA